jgi:hypothetical protein
MVCWESSMNVYTQLSCYIPSFFLLKGGGGGGCIYSLWEETKILHNQLYNICWLITDEKNYTIKLINTSFQDSLTNTIRFQCVLGLVCIKHCWLTWNTKAVPNRSDLKVWPLQVKISVDQQIDYKPWNLPFQGHRNDRCTIISMYLSLCRESAC